MISSELQRVLVMVLYSEYWSVSILRTRGSHYKNVNETKMIEYKVLVVESCVYVIYCLCDVSADKMYVIFFSINSSALICRLYASSYTTSFNC